MTFRSWKNSVAAVSHPDAPEYMIKGHCGWIRTSKGPAAIHMNSGEIIRI